MKKIIVNSSRISGECQIPTSKSQSIRSILFASMAEGQSAVSRYLASPDIFAMIKACQMLGATIEKTADKLVITGVAGQPNTPDDVIDAGNSGQVLRFIACLAGLQSQYIVITGDASIRSNRPVMPLIEALPQLGVACDSLRGDGLAPLIVKGPFTKNETSLDGEDSQPVSGLIMALALHPGEHRIRVRNAGELPWIDLTLSWLDRFAIPYKREAGDYYQISGGKTINAFEYTVPGDLSSLSFPLVAAIITQSPLTIHNVDMSEPQGDKAIVNVLQQMGVSMSIDASKRSLTVAAGAVLTGCRININDFIDCIAILAVVGCYADGETIIEGAEIARQKESDRITAIATELKKMGATIEELPDGLRIRQSNLKGASVQSYHDHRIAMSLAIAGLIAEGQTNINDTACIDKSFPAFVDVMKSVGADFTLEENNNEY